MAKPPDPIVRALTRRRLTLGLTLEQVAVRVGLSPNSGRAVSDWERGRVSPSLASLRRWSEALGVNLTLTLPRGEVPRG